MPDKSAELTELRVQRASTKGCITRIKNLIEQKGDTLSEPELECRLGILESYFKQILAFQGSIERLEPEDVNETKIRGDLEDLYCAAKAKLMQLLAGSRKASLQDYNATATFSSAVSNLPKLKLPTFSGTYSDFPNFFGSFTTLVHKDNNLTALEKFNHLLSCLRGPALRTIKEFELTEANYPRALEQLRIRYDNKYLIFQEHVKKLFNMPKVAKNSSEQLRNLIDNVNAHFSALQSLGSYENIVNAFILYITNTKLDAESQARWEEVIEWSKFPKWTECAELLNKRCIYLEAREEKKGEYEVSGSGTRKEKSRFNNSQHTALTAVESICGFCRAKGHCIDKCSKYLALSVLERFNESKKLVLCIKCLSKGHTVRKCKAPNCRVCSLPHHTLLHRYNINESRTVPGNSNLPLSVVQSTSGQAQSNQSHLIQVQSEQPQIQSRDLMSPSSSLPALGNTTQVFLATAVIKIKDKYGRYHMARALLDSASQLNFMTEHLAQTLKLNRKTINANISGIGNTSTTVRYKTTATLQSRINDFETSLELYILPHITGMKPEKSISINHWDIPPNLPLADPQFYKAQKLDLLIGADLFFRLLCVGQIQIKPDLPVLQKSLFGWIVSGKYLEKSTIHKGFSCHIACNIEGVDDEPLNKLVERFWDEQDVPKLVPKWNEEQIKCEKFFLDTSCRSNDGRFIVRLPFKEATTKLGNSLEVAKKRWNWLERKLNGRAGLKEEYSKFLDEYLAAGHMEKISLQNVPKEHYFLPHQCVLRPESSTTKLRVVFDASAQTSSTMSLNDLLMVGPTIQQDLFSIVLRFRCYQFALMADITAMYRQIWVVPDHRNFQLILWRNQSSEELGVYRLKTVTYGTASAPFLATRCLLQLAIEFGGEFPEASRIIAEDFYMDDLITGADTLEELYKIRKEVSCILDSAKFKLRKWYSNHTKFLQEIPETEREKPLHLKDSDVVKALGIFWEPKTDEFRFYYNFQTPSRTTKRTILSDIAKLYDPLGLINPVIVRAKVFLQELWLLKLSWDESISQDLEYRWNTFKTDLENLENISIPRPVIMKAAVGIELHGFADASIRAYGCCIYLRSLNAEGNISIELLTAKSKVAPIRLTRSLPCLELCAALLLAKLIYKTKNCLLKPIRKIYCWTDSEIVLDWISGHPSNWTTYVANRVSEIQGLTANFIWRHVNSKANPADIVSRGSTVTELGKSIWFSGPQFIRQPSEFWPAQKPRHDLSQLPERRKPKSILMTTLVAAEENFLTMIYEYSDWSKNCRRFALALRFMMNLKCRKNNQPLKLDKLSADEIEAAFLRIILAIQQVEFRKEVQALRDHKYLSKQSSLQKLTPILDNSCAIPLLRVGGRLKNSNLPYDSCHPILLPRNNPFVSSYIRHIHLTHFHAGPLALASIVRHKFWLINAREYCQKVVRRCIHCFRYRPKLTQQLMGELPKGRVTPGLPFTHCGVDFCGPFGTTPNLRGRCTYKSYVAIFVCFSTKAVHIEVVSALRADAFIAALKRFVGRRNLCKYLYCDNATNFVGARRQLQELREAFLQQRTQDEIQNWCSNHGINFCFIPPRAPHFGGLWESAVKSAKGLLFKTLQGVTLTFEDLTTVMVQIEAVLNSRPITPLSTDPNDEKALTPAHFLNQAPIEGIVEPNIADYKSINYLRRWQRIVALQQHFWRRWTKEYVSLLQERAKWKSLHPNVKPGMLVLIHQDDAPPYQWRLGRIVNTTAGPDGLVRVVSIKTAGNVIDRPVCKIAVLPVD